MAPYNLSSCTFLFALLITAHFHVKTPQILASLLRDLKRGGHRVLLFTQMSRMLDVFETFLNLHAHTYQRLDGSTSVDLRQRLMVTDDDDDGQ